MTQEEAHLFAAMAIEDVRFSYARGGIIGWVELGLLKRNFEAMFDEELCLPADRISMSVDFRLDFPPIDDMLHLVREYKRVKDEIVTGLEKGIFEKLSPYVVKLETVT